MNRVWRWVIVIILAALAFAYWGGERVLDAAQIVEKSQFKNRSFNGITEEISALDGRVQAYLMQEHSVPLVSVSFGFDKTGTAYEPKVGVGLLLADNITNGAGKYSRQELRDVMKEKGIHFGMAVGRDRLTFSFSYIKTFEKESLGIIKTILYQPHLAQEDLELSRRQFSAARKRQQESPQYLLQKLVKQDFYGQHPYARENIPDDDVLNKVTREDMLSYLKNALGKNNLKKNYSYQIVYNNKESENINKVENKNNSPLHNKELINNNNESRKKIIISVVDSKNRQDKNQNISNNNYAKANNNINKNDDSANKNSMSNNNNQLNKYNKNKYSSDRNILQKNINNEQINIEKRVKSDRKSVV